MECPTRTYGPCSPAAASRACRSCGGGHAVLGARDVVAPALPGAVVGADPGGGADRVGDPGPGGGELAEAVEEHDRGSAAAVAVQVQPVVAHLVGLAGGGVGALDREQRRRSRRWRRRTRRPGRPGPASAASGHGRSGRGASGRTSRPTSASIAGGHTQLSAVRVASCGEKTRRPAPVAVIATAGTAAHRWGWLVIRADRTRIIAQPSPKARSIGSGDDALGGAGEDDQGEDQGGHALRRPASRR